MAKQVVAYYPSWKSSSYLPESIPVYDLTMLIYAFGRIGKPGLQDYKLYSDAPQTDFKIIPQGYPNAGRPGQGVISRTINRMGTKPVLFAIGGAALSGPFIDAIKPANRTVFVTSIIDFLKYIKNENNGKGFAGVDIDWEPNANLWTVDNQSLINFLLFLQQLRYAMGAEGLSLSTVAVPAYVSVINNINSQYPGFWRDVSLWANYLNVMAYDLHGPWEQGMTNTPITNFHSSLVKDPNESPQAVFPNNNVTSAIDSYLAAKVPASQIILGIPAYGYAYGNVVNADAHNQPGARGLYQAFSGTYGNGTYTYKEMLVELNTGGYITYDNPYLNAAAYNPQKKSWINYNSVLDTQYKVNFIKLKGLAGAAFWELSGDISPNQGNYTSQSLIYAAKQGLS